ncbi:MAG: type II restriction endonuclease subunit M, partial [Bacteroidetes bacterium]|nr:type II restriction endonuclease subunit M [Bacteroidota bacterium]
MEIFVEAMALPPMNLACSGVAPQGKVEDWVQLVSKVEPIQERSRMENGMRALFQLFQKAPELGSLLDPSTVKADLLIASFDELRPQLMKALGAEADADRAEQGVMAAGIAMAGMILSKRYVLQITNVPYLSRGKQEETIAKYCKEHFPSSSGDLATVFLEKMLQSNTLGGISCCVTLQNWLFLGSYKKFREGLLSKSSWNFVAKLGAKAFQTPMWDFNVMLTIIQNKRPSNSHSFSGLDASTCQTAETKYIGLKFESVREMNQAEQMNNPDSRIAFEEVQTNTPLGDFAQCYQGLRTGDKDRFFRSFWEVNMGNGWDFIRTTNSTLLPIGGMSEVIFWEEGLGQLHQFASENRNKLHDMHESGNSAWGRRGVIINEQANLKASLFFGEKFDA